MLARTIENDSGRRWRSALAVPAFSETLAIDGQVAIKPAGIETPQRGSTMTAVEAKFGAPGQQEQPRWAIRRSPSGSTRTSWWCSRTTRFCTRWSSPADSGLRPRDSGSRTAMPHAA